MGSLLINSLLEALTELEEALKLLSLWDIAPPSIEALQSTAPFAADTMPFNSWLQWLFIPRVKMMLKEGMQLPKGSDIASMGEVYAMKVNPEAASIIGYLRRIDVLMNAL